MQRADGVYGVIRYVFGAGGTGGKNSKKLYKYRKFFDYWIYFKRRVVIVAGAELLLGILFLCFDRYSYAVIIMVSNLLGIWSVIGVLLSGKIFMYGRKKHDFDYNKYI